MKKIILPAFIFCALIFISCKKDRACECTITTVNSNGTSTTSNPETTVYKNIKASEARSICQNNVVVSTNSSGLTTTTNNDCKLK